jgi:hypothetical protein
MYNVMRESIDKVPSFTNKSWEYYETTGNKNYGEHAYYTQRCKRAIHAPVFHSIDNWDEQIGSHGPDDEREQDAVDQIEDGQTGDPDSDPAG